MRRGGPPRISGLAGPAIAGVPDRRGPVPSDHVAERHCHRPGLSGSDDRLSSDFGEQAAGDIWNPSTSLATPDSKPFNTFAVGASSACEVDGSVVSLVACSPKSPDK